MSRMKSLEGAGSGIAQNRRPRPARQQAQAGGRRRFQRDALRNGARRFLWVVTRALAFFSGLVLLMRDLMRRLALAFWAGANSGALLVCGSCLRPTSVRS